MAPENRSTSETSREQRNQAIKEDINHILEEIWYSLPDEPFCKIFSREAKKGMRKVFQISRLELLDLTWREDDGTLYRSRAYEVGEIRMLNHYKVHLNTKGKFPYDPNTFRYNSTNREDWDYFILHLE